MIRTQTACLLLVFAAALTSCHDGQPTGPTPPTTVQPPVSPPVPPPPPAGIQLAGTVTDAAWRRLPGARVEVVDGPQAGLSTTVNANGEFRLTGAFDETTQFRATMEGHGAATAALPPICVRCNPNWWLHFSLEALTPHANLAGNYTLTFTAAKECASLPDDVRTRTYKAEIAPMVSDATNSRFVVTVSDAKFLERFNSFTIGLAGEYLASDLGDLHGFPGLVEEIGQNTYLTFGGEVRASVTDASFISASFIGDIARCELPGEWGSSRYSCSEGPVLVHGQCGPRIHQFIFSRR